VGTGVKTRSRSSFPSIGCVGIAPQEPVYWWLLPTPTCARPAVPQGTFRMGLRCAQTRFLSALPLAIRLALEDGGSALPDAETADQSKSSSISAFLAAETTVLRSSIARVIGPTPPGTGVMASTVSAAAS